MARVLMICGKGLAVSDREVKQRNEENWKRRNDLFD
ncbi:MAG: hypothetical protein ACI8UZ_002647 [Akkermansiaceae bacterium]|jgi:hypothetical protein